MSVGEEKHGNVTCDTPWGRWYQTVEEVFIDINAPVGTKGKDVQCGLQSRKLTASIGGKTIIDGKLPFTIHVDESTWSIVDQKLVQICLAKADPYSTPAWKSLLEDEYKMDPVSFDEMEKKIMLQKVQSQHPGFDCSNATVSGNYHNGGPDLRT